MQAHRSILTRFAVLFIAPGLMSPRSLAASASEVQWVKFQDPFEQAFTIDTPQGWTAKGGLFRLGFSDYRLMFDVQSPKRDIQIRSGDVAIRSYSLPNQYHPTEGETYDLGAQAQMVTARYRTGKEFASLYVLTRFKLLCETLTPQTVDQAPPIKEPEQGADVTKSSAGAIAYRCDSSQSAEPGASRIAYVYARTTQFGSSLWQVTALVSYLAPSDKLPLVRSILMHASQSFLLNPQWIEYQKKMDAEGLQYQAARQRQRMQALAQQVRQFEARMQGMRDQVSAFERQQNARNAQFQSFDNVLNGITPTVDPLNGQTRDVWTGPHGGYWVNGLGTIVNSNTSPGAGFHQLQEVKP